jgi:DNA-binding HxlR family transcriptional regulator
MFHGMEREVIESVRKLRDKMVKIDIIDVIILRCLSEGADRYTALEECVEEYGITLRNALANRLLKLRERGYVTRGEGGIYVLTEDGRELLKIVRALAVA